MGKRSTTQEDIALAAARASGCPCADSRLAFHHFLEVLRDIFLDARDGDEIGIELRGFGTFTTAKRRGNPTARNFHTGARISVPDRRVVRWKPSSKVTFQVRGGHHAHN